MAETSFVSFPDDIRSASIAIRGIGEEIDQLSGSGPMRDAASAMPGAASRAHLEALAEDWSTVVTGLGGRTEAHAEALRVSAERYADIDTSITAAMNAISPWP